MEKVSLKLVVLYIFMTYMAIVILKGRLLPGHTNKEPVQPKEVAEGKKVEKQTPPKKDNVSKNNNPKDDVNKEKNDVSKNNNPKSNANKEKKGDNTNDGEEPEVTGKFPHTIVPALRSPKSHFSTPVHLFEGTTN